MTVPAPIAGHTSNVRGTGRARVAVALLTPALVVVLGLFGGGLALAVAQSLGAAPVTGDGTLSLSSYTTVLRDPEFVSSVLTSLWIAAASTLLALALGTAAALTLRSSAAVSRGLALLQAALPVPHLVGAIAFSLALADSGLLSRLANVAGLAGTPADFPALVQDPHALGIILTYAWKETPFVAVVALSALGPRIREYETMARTLAAGPGARLRHVTLPLLAPALLAAGMLVFAFTFGAYEVPALLGRSYPEALPVLAYRGFSAVELDARPAGLAVAVLISVVGALATVGYGVAARILATRTSW
ncbi:ABC transporter permease subunit [Amycolatopsis sp. H20-H5]|uniref:ABC transporter permease subunit n=1 Tax=Amycolatopsis sp. H20-H5 TaxID=3046309 RepID=UPI002DBAE42C|nr:ABC transporter permease subunit [Amycolatopsis sp. H20-H5]MEC3975843.1 ABC transporter permease subunit [Amycolatopsis sp. H20-H5]